MRGVLVSVAIGKDTKGNRSSGGDGWVLDPEISECVQGGGLFVFLARANVEGREVPDSQDGLDLIWVSCRGDVCGDEVSNSLSWLISTLI